MKMKSLLLRFAYWILDKVEGPLLKTSKSSFDLLDRSRDTNGSILFTISGPRHGRDRDIGLVFAYMPRLDAEEADYDQVDELLDAITDVTNRWSEDETVNYDTDRAAVEAIKNMDENQKLKSFTTVYSLDDGYSVEAGISSGQ